MFVAGLQQRALTENLNGTWNRPPGRHWIQIAEGPVLDPCAKQIYFRRDPKVDPLRIESGPSWRARFWSLHFVRCAEILQAAMCAECQASTYANSIRGRTLELGRPEFASPIFLVFEGPKIDPSKRPPLGRRSWHGWQRGTQCHQNTMSGRKDRKRFYNTFCISSNLSNCCYLIQVSSPHPLLYSCKLPKGECALFYGGFLGFPLQSVGFPRGFPGVSQGFPRGFRGFPPQLQAFLKPNPKKE